MIELGYSHEDVIKMTKSLPTIYCLNIDNIKKSIEVLKQNKIDYEFRTTLVKEFHTEEDFRNSFRFWQLLQFSINNNLRKTYSKPDLIVTPTNYSKKLIENYDFVDLIIATRIFSISVQS